MLCDYLGFGFVFVWMISVFQRNTQLGTRHLDSGALQPR